MGIFLFIVGIWIDKRMFICIGMVFYIGGIVSIKEQYHEQWQYHYD